MGIDNSHPPLQKGTLFAGKYRLDRILAEGGMGIVVGATHVHLEQAVALKFLRVDGQLDGIEARARFQREAKAAAQLRSEHVANVIDAGVTDDGIAYMAMEYLEGDHLAHILQFRGAFDIADAVEYVIQACEGLAEAHACGIVHRDIKPHNLFLVHRTLDWRIIKILDFGISKFMIPESSNLSTGAILGSPCYMSPEQLRSTATVDHRTDFWSLGATLYELLCGRAAYDASQSLPELVTAILDGPAPRVRAVRPEVPPELEAVVLRCMSKDRAARFSSAGELAAALMPFAPHRARTAAERANSMRPAFAIEETAPAASTYIGNPWAPLPALSPEDESARSAVRGLQPVARTLPPPPPGSTGTRSGAARGKRWLAERSSGIASAIVAALVIASGAAVSRWRHAAPPPLANAMVSAVAGGAPALARIAPASAPVTTATEVQRIQIGVRATPSFARITLDDKPLENPFLGTFAKDGSTHKVTVTAPGYDPKSKNISFAADTLVDMDLERRSRPAAAPAPLPRATVTWGSPAGPTPKPAVAMTESPPLGTLFDPGPLPDRRGERRAIDTNGHFAPGVNSDDITQAPGQPPIRPIDTSDPYGSR